MASENRQGKRVAKDADKVEVAPGVTVGSLRRFRAALTGRTQDSRSGVDCNNREAYENPESTLLYFSRYFALMCKCEVVVVIAGALPKSSYNTLY